MEDGRLYKFMSEMKEAGFKSQVVMEQGYYYALQLQYEEVPPLRPLSVVQFALHGEGVSATQMERAAAWVAACNLALGIHPVQGMEIQALKAKR